MIDHPRTAILYYAWDTLHEALDVGGRVYLHRPRNLDFYEFPAACVFFEGETIVPFSGSEQIPDEYLRSADISLNIFVENPNDPDKELRAEAYLNSLGRQAELALHDDPFFAQRLSSYTGSLQDPGLISGLSLTTVEPFRTEVNDRIIMCQSLTFRMSYLDTPFSIKKFEAVESYLVEIRKVGWDENTVDPVLTAAEGDFE